MEKSILITGSAGNLGGAVLNKFEREGYRIAAIDSPRSAPKVRETAQVKSYPADLMDEERVAELVSEVFAEFGRISMGVFTVGGFAMGSLEATGAGDFDKMYRLNFLTAFNIARQLFIRMREQEGGGQLVFIGSRPALHAGLAKDMLAYSLTKSLVFRLAEVIKEAGRTHNISASVVVPGTMDTPQNRSVMPDADFSKWVDPNDIAEKIYQLSNVDDPELRDSLIEMYGG